MPAGVNGLPDPSRLQSFVGVDAAGGAAGHPVDLKTGPGGDLFYVDMEGGAVHRITYTAANQSPTAAIAATPTNGPVPLTVSFDGTGSSDPEGKPLSYSWDLNGDGAFGDATTATTSNTYTAAGVYHPSLRVTDDRGASDTASESSPTAKMRPEEYSAHQVLEQFTNAVKSGNIEAVEVKFRSITPELRDYFKELFSKAGSGSITAHSAFGDGSIMSSEKVIIPYTIDLTYTPKGTGQRTRVPLSYNATVTKQPNGHWAIASLETPRSE